jgi:cytoplasmic iron level regulating protein YaaA (DUF328/UPF0246 family)
MYAVISPAKKLNCSGWDRNLDFTHPSLISQTTKLVGEMKNKSADDIGKLMKISEKLAALNHERYQSFSNNVESPEAKPAALMFDGDTFTGLQANDFAEADWNFAQQHLGILSGLYGLLRPLDLIQPHRLEMGTRLKTDRGTNLYGFWGDEIANLLQDRNATSGDGNLINLASNEYFKSVARPTLDMNVITPSFKEMRDGKLKLISFSAKRARGAMARFIIKNHIQDAEELKSFDLDGYRYDSSNSDENEWLFVR